MRLFIGIVMALLAVIGVWLLTMETPPVELATAKELAPAAATADAERVSNDYVEQQANAADEADAKVSSEPSALEQALVRYPNVAVEDIQTIFAEDPELIGLRPDFMLALMERGDIAPNQVVVSAPRMGPLTASMFVIANARNSFSVEHFDRLINLGADINGGETWRSVMAMESNPAVLDKWYQHASLGPETHEELYNKALAVGNPELRDYLLDEKGGQQSDLQIEPMNKVMAAGMVRGTVESLDELHQLITSDVGVNGEVARHEVSHFLNLRVRQAQMLKALTNDDKELQELGELEQKLVDKINELEQGSN